MWFCLDYSNGVVTLYFSDEIIGHRNQGNGFLDRNGGVKSRNDGQDEVSPGKPAISFKIDVNEIILIWNHITCHSSFLSWFIEEIPCVPKDSDTCLQNTDGWEDYVCNHLKEENYHEYCDSWPKDTRRCCPESCENTVDFTESVCEASEGSGTCKYPNEAQCSEIYTLTFI